MDPRTKTALSRLISPRPSVGLFAHPIFVLAALLLLFSSVGGALRLRTGLSLLSPKLQDELSTQDRELARGAWHSLLVKYHNLIETGQRQADLHFLLGRLYSRIGLPRPALEEFASCLELAPHHPLAHEERAICAIGVNDVATAREALDAGRQLGHSERRLVHLEAMLAFNKGNFEHSLQLFDSYPAAPCELHVQLEHARCAYRAEYLQKALGLAKDITAREPRCTSARELMALVFIRQGRLEYARSALLGKLLPAWSPTRRLVALLDQVASGALSRDAIIAYYQAKALSRDDVAAKLSLLDEAIAFAPNFALAHVARCELFLPDSPKVALAYLDGLSVELRHNSVISLRHGLLLRDVGRLDEAIAAMQRACKAKPRSAETYLRLALLFEETRHPGEALTTARRALQLAPADPRLWKLTSRLHTARGCADAARACAHEARLLGS